MLFWSLCMAAEDQANVDALGGVESADVIVDGVRLFGVAGSTSFPSAQRAKDVRTRIVAVARDPTITAQDFSLQPREGRIDILARGRHLLAVVDGDAQLEGVSRNDAAQVRSLRIQQAIAKYRADRTPHHLTRAGIAAVLGGLAAVLTLILLLRITSHLERVLEPRYRNRVQSVSISSFEVVRAETIWNAIRSTIFAVRVFLALVVAYLGLAFVLGQFPWTRGLAASLLTLISEPALKFATAILEYLPNLIFLVLLALVVRYALKLTHVFSRAVASGAVPLKGFDADWAQPTYHIVRALIVLLALVIAYPYLPGSGSPAFQGLSIFAGLMLSLGASSAMASLIAGYTVTYRRAFRVGDRIAVGDLVGEVTDLRLMVTHLRTPKNEEIVVPNSLVLTSHIVNYSKLSAVHGLILHTLVRIGYATPWRQVEALLLEAAKRTPDILKQPLPFVLEKSLDEFSIAYELNVYVQGAHGLLERYAALHRNILDVFNEYGVQIMVPGYEGDPEKPKVVPPQEWFASPAVRTDSLSVQPRESDRKQEDAVVS